VEVVPKAVWSQKTTICRATNFTLFRLLLESERLKEARAFKGLRHNSRGAAMP
jgi:hypothetical protein